MMTEYIEREKVLSKAAPVEGCFSDMISAYDVAMLPAEDVAPVRHGHWISLTECANEGVYCSICKKKVWKSDYALCSHKSRNKLRSDYCPNCGAKMDGGDGNSDIA